MTTSDQLSAFKNEFYELVKHAKNELDVSDEDFVNLPSVIQIRKDVKETKKCNKMLISSILFLVVFALPSTLILSIFQETNFGHFCAERLLSFSGSEDKLEETTCLIPALEFVADKFRTPVNCEECAGVQGIKRVKNLSPQEFLDEYAFSMQPVIIEDAQVNWTATKTFSFDLFKKIYSDKEALEKVDKDCQFFPYRTELASLGEFLNMSGSRVNGEEEPWYVGWSNCDGKTANILREHYKTPYFLPRYLDHSNTDWVFMGLPGYGANMHIDNVGAHSWQAQVKGTKKWTLQAPPECYWTCIDEMEIVVNPGEIIVLDTNKWFHQTLIMGNETSIVIGSEYF